MRRWAFVWLAACGGGSETNPGVDGTLPDTPQGTTKEGIVLLRQETILDMNLTVHIAEFRDGTFATGSRVDGPCRIDSGVDTPIGAKVSGGSITFTGAAATTTIAPDDVTNDYDGEITQGFLYAAGEQIEIVATGGPVVPAFSTTVSFPGSILVSEPADELTPLTIDRAAGFTATWSGDAPVRLTLTQLGHGVFIDGRYDGVTTATVPPSALADLVPGMTNEHQINVTITGETPTRVVAGDFDIDIQVLEAGFTGRGTAL
jgi:hypothetical protein